MSSYSNQTFNFTGFNQQQQQQQQSHSLKLSHPTSYHIQQSQMKMQSDGNFGSPMDPSFLQMQQQFAGTMNIKKESSPDFYTSEDVQMHNSSVAPMVSPITIARQHTPSTFDTGDDLHGSFNPSSFATSPGNGSVYSPGPDDFLYDGNEFSTGLPHGSMPAFSSMDMKNHVGVNHVRFGNHVGSLSSQLGSSPADMHGGFHSMSVPTHTGDWFHKNMDQDSLTGSPPTSLQGQNGNVSMMATLLENEEPESAAKQIQLLYEKRRRRRESHNAVERRRRDNINDKIQELSTLVPDCYSDNVNKPNKGIILKKSVDYIRHLQQLIQQQDNRNQELEAMLSKLQGGKEGGKGLGDNSGGSSLQA
ncbi:hypothetical protein K7432_004145 [Basidiobolus ranarum]|uniref:BHLH domain-containing protein n=1 Tax=Basidiobolus ranarum TaxID=34480 RepID=A0ABR2W5G0_9FUNG